MLVPARIDATSATGNLHPRALRVLPAALFGLALALPVTAHADEGMWPFNMVPKERVQKDHGVTLTDAWLDHVRLASVRFNSGGSGSFVSANGLVLTNHHVASNCIAKLARQGHDYLDTGYLAGKASAASNGGAAASVPVAAQADLPEAKCPDLELNVLQSIEDVTEKVRSVRKEGMSDAKANVAIKGQMTTIEKACADSAGASADARSTIKARCDVVTLYAGGRYDLYTYKKYTDVRLVFAPEQTIAFFGGDPDNFNYPRFDLDMALFRVYDGESPVKPKSYLHWNAAGPKDGDTVFVSGHPGATGRMQTMAELVRLRDLVYPYAVAERRRERDLMNAFGAESIEAKREIRQPVFGLENGIKAVGGFLGGLRDPALMKKKSDDEAALRKAIDADPKLKAAYGTVFADVERAEAAFASIYKRHAALEVGPRSDLFGAARLLYRMPTELEVPNEKRLREFRSSNLDSLRLQLFSPAPIYGEVEVAHLRSWLERLARDLGPADPLVKAILFGRTPERTARDLVAGSKLTDVYARRALEAGGRGAVTDSSDPMMALVRAMDGDARAVRKRFEDEVEGPMRAAGEKIAQATFAVRGTSVAPDATFTLRLATGVVKGYGAVPWATDFADLYKHATGKDPLALPPRWVEKKASLDGKIPFNFVSTNDIIGGNSGSPVVDTKGDIVGLIFDGNLTSLPNRFVYGETTQRAVSVDTAGMTEALKKVYGADAVVSELIAP